MGERSILEIAEALESGIAVEDITYIDGTVCKVKSLDSVYDAIMLEILRTIKAGQAKLCEEFLYAVLQYRSFFRKTTCGTILGPIYM